jgi:hypothetical protein
MRYLLLLLIFTAPTAADVLLNYNGFYGRMKKLQLPEYSDITLAFALVGEQSGRACQFYSIKLISQEHNIILDVAQNGEISLPYDESLKNSNAMLEVLQADNTEPCQLQFRLRSRMRLSADVDLDTLIHFRRQFELLLDDIAGFSKYWLPDVVGVIAEFDADVSSPQLQGGAAAVTHCSAKRCQIQLTEPLAADSRWLFSQRPNYLLPLMRGGTE